MNYILGRREYVIAIQFSNKTSKIVPLHYFLVYTKLNSNQCADFDKKGTGGPFMDMYFP